MSEADLVVGVLWVAATLYAVFAGADFGAGLWDLLAGDSADGVWITFATVIVLYVALGVGATAVLRGMSRRWRHEGEDELDVPYGPPTAP